MRVSTRIISGFGVLMVLAVVALIYHFHVIRQLQSVNHALSAVNLEATRAAVRLQSDVSAIDEFSKKYFQVDPDHYRADLEESWSELEKDLSSLQHLPVSEKERTDVKHVADAWLEYRRQWSIQLEQQDPEDRTEYFPLDLDTRLKLLMERSINLERTIKTAVDARVGEADATGVLAQRLSWAAGAVAIVIGGLISILLVRAINQPLRQLTQGTRAISQGDFSHRIPAGGRDEFAELARDFNTMSQRLGELDQMKRDFVSHVSHELKAPLASIRQTAHLLLEEIPGSLNDQQKRLLRLSYANAERLAAMVGNLLDASRLEAGSMEYVMAPIDLLSLVKTVAEEFQVQANEKQISIRIESGSKSGVIVAGDRDRVVQVIGNLFDNALKFSPRGSELVASVDEQVDGSERSVVFSLADSGPGVADAHKEKIFQKFHQVKQGRKISGQGVGLGLAICKSIVEAHQGKIWVKDNPSGGSIFCVQLQAVARMEVATSCG